MAAIYLVRHGQASFGAADYDVLSELGHRQSAVLGAELRRRGVRPTLVRSGTLRRQKSTATAALAAANISVDLQVDERWNEYDHVDVLRHHGEGAALTEQSVLDGALARWVAAGENSPCAETWPKFTSRFNAVITELTTSLGRGQSAVVFTSGGVIGLAVADLIGGGVAAFLALNRVTVNAAITKIVTGRSGTTLLSFNDHAHFEGVRADLLSYR
jgi:broad specificity phosphatase PhoE